MSDSEMKNIDNLNSKSEASSPDLHIYVKGVAFHLYKEMLAKRSAKISLLLERNEIDDLPWIIRDLETEPETFELVARFCYGLEAKFSSDNIISVLCIAYYLGMNDEHSSSNLLGKASEFLETQVFPNWNETVNALRSGDKSFDKLTDVGLVDLFFDSLIDKASYDPRLLGEPNRNEEDTNDYRPNPRRRLFVPDWKSEDLITIPLRFYEPLMIRAVKSCNIPVEYIVSSLCKYAKKWVFDTEESFLGQKREAIEAVELLLPQERGLISCEFLFESLKHSISLEASSDCRNGFVNRISKQLDTAKPTDFKIFGDTELVKTVVTGFYCYYADKDSENVSHFVKVAKVLEEFLFLAASEASLELKAFVALAEIAVASSHGVLRYSDGIYKAIDVFFESHRYLTESEKMEACDVLDCDKLSQEACEEAAKNQRLPIRIVVQVLFASQLQLRDRVAKEIKGIEERVDDEKEGEIRVSSNEDEMSTKLLGFESENHQCVKKKKRSVWKEMKRKFGCLTSPSSLSSCTSHVNKKKKKTHLH